MVTTDSAGRVLLRGGSVYSPADPFATAMLVAGDAIAWIGSEGAALAMADGVDEVIELEGALVVPAFVDAWSAGADPGAAGQGVGLRLVPDGACGAGPVPSLVAGGGDAPRAVIGADPLPEGLAAGTLLVVSTLDAAAVPHVLASGAALCLTPDAEQGLGGLPLASLAAAGVALALGSGSLQADPWGLIAAAIHHPDPMQRISARAAFAAHTRGGWRALGYPGRGVLVPAAAADYSVWAVGDLVVQAPDDRIQAWSTDPRSGTPGLPDLSPGAPRPRCLRTVVDGRTIFAGGDAEVSR